MAISNSEQLLKELPYKDYGVSHWKNLVGWKAQIRKLFK